MTQPGAAMKVKTAAPWKLDRIIPYPGNPRTHPPEQIEILAQLLLKYGADQPIVVDESGVILKGHGRLQAALVAGLKTFPVVVRTGMSGPDKVAMRLSDNQVALLSGWDRGLVAGELRMLSRAGYDIPLLGFGEAQLRGWGVAIDEFPVDPEDAPLPQKRPVVRKGDLWALGTHRMLCGDATKPEGWSTLFRREMASLVFTDPPYGVSYAGRSGKFEVIEGDDKRRDDLYRMLVESFKNMTRHSTDLAAFYIWHASSSRNDFAEAMTAAGLIERQYLIWAKPSISLGYSDYQWAHEPCFYASKGPSPKFYGDATSSTIWRVGLVGAKSASVTLGTGLLVLDGTGRMLYLQPKPPKAKKVRELRLAKDRQELHVVDESGSGANGTMWEVARERDYEHPTQKPVELARRAIENSSLPGEIVADGFLGSGTTLIAAEITGRRCFGLELDPIYADIVVRRWERFAGRAATLGETGKTFEVVARERLKEKAPA
jgi:DNA modification methylase